VKKWPVSVAIKKFKSLWRDAFIPREMSNMPLIGAFSSLYHGSLYKTRPLEKTLKINFPDEPFFGGARSHEMPIKVAVTATTSMQQEAVVFANYNRQDAENKSKAHFHVEKKDIGC
jgi:hypothetical protein